MSQNTRISLNALKLGCSLQNYPEVLFLCLHLLLKFSPWRLETTRQISLLLTALGWTLKICGSLINFLGTLLLNTFLLISFFNYFFFIYLTCWSQFPSFLSSHFSLSLPSPPFSLPSPSTHASSISMQKGAGLRMGENKASSSPWEIAQFGDWASKSQLQCQRRVLVPPLGAPQAG